MSVLQTLLDQGPKALLPPGPGRAVLWAVLLCIAKAQDHNTTPRPGGCLGLTLFQIDRATVTLRDLGLIHDTPDGWTITPHPRRPT